MQRKKYPKRVLFYLLLTLLRPVLLQLPVQRGVTVAQVRMFAEIIRQQTEWNSQCTNSGEVNQIVINGFGIDALLVELEIRQLEDIHAVIIAQQVGSPRLNNGSQLSVEVHTEQLSQRCAGCHSLFFAIMFNFYYYIKHKKASFCIITRGSYYPSDIIHQPSAFIHQTSSISHPPNW